MIETLIALAIAAAMVPFVFWFVRNYKRSNDKNYSYKYDVATKWAFIIMIPVSILLTILVFVLA